MSKVVKNQILDQERALYNLQDAQVLECTFAGPADGESALKEVRHVTVDHCSFSLRYPLWHAKDFRVLGSRMDEKTRAAIWYAERGQLSDSVLHGIKCLRECADIQIAGCDILSPEFGWRCRDLTISHTALESEYLLFESRNMDIDHLDMRGKYSFQYTQNVRIRDSKLDTKDAFWHCENVTVENSVVKGEYLGWYSTGLTLVNCRIIGTQPLCYCRNLKLVNCTMEGTDLAFEYSDVEAEIQGHVDSIKNPRSGTIVADSVGEIIREDAVMDVNGEVVLRGGTL